MESMASLIDLVRTGRIAEGSRVLYAHLVIGAEELFSVIGSVKRGESGHALLVSSVDGTVIAGRDAGDVMKRLYPAFAQLQENLQGKEAFPAADQVTAGPGG